MSIFVCLYFIPSLSIVLLQSHVGNSSSCLDLLFHLSVLVSVVPYFFRLCPTQQASLISTRNLPHNFAAVHLCFCASSLRRHAPVPDLLRSPVCRSVRPSFRFWKILRDCCFSLLPADSSSSSSTSQLADWRPSKKLKIKIKICCRELNRSLVRNKCVEELSNIFKNNRIQKKCPRRVLRPYQYIEPRLKF